MIMEISPIKNITQYETYCAEAGRLVAIDPEPNSDDGKRLALLSLIIETYEKEVFTFDKPTPIEAITFRMEQQKLNQSDLIQYLGTRSRVSEILLGRRQLTLPMIRKLSEGLGIPASFLIGREDSPIDNFDEDMEIDWSAFPIKEMVKAGYLPSVSGKNYPAEEVKNFFSCVGGVEAVSAFCRRSRSNTKTTSKVYYALMAWSTQVLRQASSVALENKFTPGSVDAGFKSTLARISVLNNAPIIAKDYLLKHGIILVILEQLKGTKLDGACLLLNDSTPVIGLTLRFDRLDYFWFTLMHEVIHIERHLFKYHVPYFDNLEDLGKGSIEVEADRYSREAFIPRGELRRSQVYEDPDEESVIELAKKFGIHPAIIAGQLRHELNKFTLLSNLIGNGEVRKLFR